MKCVCVCVCVCKVGFNFIKKIIEKVPMKKINIYIIITFERNGR